MLYMTSKILVKRFMKKNMKLAVQLIERMGFEICSEKRRCYN